MADTTLAVALQEFKRQRRPSVRLADLTAVSDPAKPHPRRPTADDSAGNLDGESSRLPMSPPTRRNASKQHSRPLTIPSSPKGDAFLSPVPDSVAFDGKAAGFRRARDVKARRSSGGDGARRFRSSWTMPRSQNSADVVKLGTGEGAGENGDQGLGVGGEELCVEDSESPMENSNGLPRAKARVRVRVSDDRDLGIVADSEENNLMVDDRGNGVDGNTWCARLDEGGVRAWLDRLGLGRYSTVFEVHGVDDEVLPLLTLEDLRDMGIMAVGSRRKLFSAIQKLEQRH